MAYSADAVVGENEGVRMDHVFIGAQVSIYLLKNDAYLFGCMNIY